MNNFYSMLSGLKLELSTDEFNFYRPLEGIEVKYLTKDSPFGDNVDEIYKFHSGDLLILPQNTKIPKKEINKYGMHPFEMGFPKFDISILKNRKIINVEGFKSYSRELIFNFADITSWVMKHKQECCENVRLEEWHGDENDLFDATVIDAYESSGDHPDGKWTFYNIQTNKGTVTLRWLGTSSGYYSVDVNIFRKI